MNDIVLEPQTTNLTTNSHSIFTERGPVSSDPAVVAAEPFRFRLHSGDDAAPPMESLYWGGGGELADSFVSELKGEIRVLNEKENAQAADTVFNNISKTAEEKVVPSSSMARVLTPRNNRSLSISEGQLDSPWSRQSKASERSYEKLHSPSSRFADFSSSYQADSSPVRVDGAQDEVETSTENEVISDFDTKAYSAWKAQGLMGRGKTRSSRKTALPSRTSLTDSRSSDARQPPETIMFVSTSLEEYEDTMTESELDTAEGNFSETLHEWQNKSDQNLNGHFLSPPLSSSTRDFFRSDSPKNDMVVHHESSEIHCDTDEFGLQNSQCTCSKSMFSRNDALVDFYLPKLGMACLCGKGGTTISASEDPTLLENILRPWQVDFLHTVHIRKGDELVKVYHRRGDLLAKELKLWRHENGMPEIRTESCVMALHIWSRTCKAYVRSVRKQLAMGRDEIEQPDMLEALSSFMGANESSFSGSNKERWSLHVAIEPESQAEI